MEDKRRISKVIVSLGGVILLYGGSTVSFGAVLEEQKECPLKLEKIVRSLFLSEYGESEKAEKVSASVVGKRSFMVTYSVLVQSLANDSETAIGNKPYRVVVDEECRLKSISVGAFYH